MGFSLSASSSVSGASVLPAPPSAAGWSSQKVAETLTSRWGKKTSMKSLCQYAFIAPGVPWATESELELGRPQGSKNKVLWDLEAKR